MSLCSEADVEPRSPPCLSLESDVIEEAGLTLLLVLTGRLITLLTVDVCG